MDSRRRSRSSPEIIAVDGRRCIAAFKPNIDGMHIAPLRCDRVD